MKNQRARGTHLLFTKILAGALVCGCSSSDLRNTPAKTTQYVYAPGWADLAGGTSGPAVSVSGSTLEVWTQAAGQLWRNTYSPPHWSGWGAPLGGPPGGAVGVPAVTSYLNGVAIIAKSPDNKIWWQTWNRASNVFSAWAAVGPVPGHAFGSLAATAPNFVPAPQQLYVWARGLDNNLWMTRYDFTSSSWSAWSASGGSPPGGITNSPAAIAIPGLTQFSFTQEIVVRDASGQPWRRTYDGNWSNFPGQASGWEPLGGVIKDSPVLAAVPGGMELWGVDPNGWIWRNSHPTGGAWAGWSAQLDPPAGGVNGGEHPSLALVRRGGTFTSGEDIIVRGSATNLWYRPWYDAGPVATAPTSAKQKSLTLPIWENTSLSIPAGQAGCGVEGAFLVSVGASPRVWRTTLNCIDSANSTCASDSDVFYGSTNWPTVDISGSDDRPQDSNDQQMVRLSDGTLLLVHQGVRRDEGTTAGCETPQGTCRGAEYVFRSEDCGASWQILAVLDPAFDGPGDSDRYYNHNTQGGHDRVELYADPYTAGRVYMTMAGVGDTVSAVALYRSDDSGASWAHAGELPIGTPAVMTSVSSGRLYISGWFGGGPPHNMGVVSYDPGSGTLSGALSVGSDAHRHSFTSATNCVEGGPPSQCSGGGWCQNGKCVYGLRVSSGSEGIARIGSFSDGDYLRVHNTYKRGNGDFGLVVRNVKVANNLLTVLNSEQITAPLGNSIVGSTAVETDRLEWTENLQLNPSMIYWYEVQTAGSGGNFGPMRARYKYFFDTSSGPTGCLSLTGTSCRTWTTATSAYGDYQKGSFFRSSTGDLKFVALWAEQASLSSSSVRTSILSLTP